MSNWLDKYPQLAALRDDPRLAALGLRWLDSRDEALADQQARVKTYDGDAWSMGVLWIGDLWEASGEDARQRLRVADGPASTRLNAVELSGGLFVDARMPDRLFYTPNDEIPPPLWVEVEPDAAHLAALLAEYHPPAPPARSELPARRRAFAGRLFQLQVPSPYSGQLEHAGPHELSRFFVFSPCIDSRAWGSAYADNPWPDEHIPPLQQGILARRLLSQNEGAVCTITRRTLFSRAHVSLELHRAGRYVWELRYCPSAFPATLQRFNERFGSAFDVDLPVDVVGGLLGFGYMQTPELLRRIAEHEESAIPEAVAYWLENLLAVEYNNLEITELLRRYLRSDSPVVKAAVVNRSIEYHWRFLIEDMAFHEADPEFVAFFDRRLDGGFAPPPVNEFGEPDDLWDSLGEHEDEEEEDA
ncbi:MAG: hypothetical protein OHK0022_35240 [Roseiflexaceae bacterium]